MAWVMASGVHPLDVNQVVNRVLLAPALLGMSLFAWLLIRSITRLLRETVSAPAKGTCGHTDLTLRLPTKGNDGLTQVAHGFNSLVAAVHRVTRSMADTRSVGLACR